MKISLLFILACSLLISGCEKQGNERLEEKAKIEGGAAAQEQAIREKQLLTERSKEMEVALSSQQDFYESRSGHFEGYVTKGAEKFQVKISIFPNISRYTQSRIRTPGEIEKELIDLAFNAQIMQWHGKELVSSTECKVLNLRPNIKTGELNIISPDCKYTYYLRLDNNEITGTAQPPANPTLLFGLSATRVEESARQDSVK